MTNPNRKSDRNTEMLSEFMDGATFAEIARRHNITPPSVRQTLLRYGGKGITEMMGMEVGNKSEKSSPKLREVIFVDSETELVRLRKYYREKERRVPPIVMMRPNYEEIAARLRGS